MAKGVKRALMVAREIGSPERKQAFEQWGGSPERWYHGTSKDVDFSKFKVGRHGAWFTRNPETASMYAKENDSQGYKYGPDETGRLTYLRTNTRSRVIPVHLKFGKAHTGQLPDDVMGSTNYKKAQSDWFDRLRAQGYDSWVPEGGDVAVVLKNPANIKSAIGNVGTFDPNEADIGKARGGATKDERRALMIARDHQALLRRVANIYQGPRGGMDPSPGGGGYAGPGGGKYIGPSNYAKGGKIPPFKLHSGAAKLIAQKGQAKATPQQYAAIPGIKPDELKHSKFEALGNKALPKEQVLEHLRGNTIPLQETVYSRDDEESALQRYTTPSQSIALPGGENYREVLLHLPPAAHVPSPELSNARERAEAATRAFDDALADQLSGAPRLSDEAYRRASSEADAARIALARLEREDKRAAANPEGTYKSSHWDQPNVLAHLRMSDRKGPNGEKVLHVEEVQSDWGQEGRERGFNGPRKADMVVQPIGGGRWEIYNRGHGRTAVNFEGDEGIFNTRAEAEAALPDFQDDPYEHTEGVPSGPYVDNTQKWTDLALKRVLHEAAHGGYDKIVFTPGAEQNKRYSLAKQVRSLHYYRHPDIGEGSLQFIDKRGKRHSQDATDADLPGIIGKETAEKLLATPLTQRANAPSNEMLGHHLEGEDLEVGGQGMRGYYDNILPKRLQALAQQHDPQAKVQLHAHKLLPGEAAFNATDEDIRAHHGMSEDEWNALSPEQSFDRWRDYRNHIVRITPPTEPLHSLDVTPQMRDSIKQNGFNQFKRGGSVEDERIRAALARTVSPFSENPEHVKEALRIASTFQIPTTKTGPGGYYGIAQDRSPEEVSVKLAGLPGVKPKAVRKMSWEDLHKKGGSFINLGGDRSTFGRLTRINGEPLAWPVDLHAGPNYMRELNPGLVWANAPGHATSLTNVMRRAAEKGPVYGIYAPMGPRAVDSAHHMFDAVMAQIPGRNISKKDAAEFDAQIKQGLHMPPKKRAAAIKALEKWPGILNAKEASEFARTLPGEQRSGIVQHMDKKSWKDKGFPQIGVTRVAVTDPDVFSAPGNMLGHRVVQLDPDKMVAESKFKHGTYSAPTAGEYVGDVPLVQRHYAAPDVIEQRLLKPTVAGDIIHPYSAAPVGRSSARKIFEEQKNIQPLSQKQLDSVMLGLQRQKEYGLKRGGTVKRALDIAKKVTRG